MAHAAGIPMEAVAGSNTSVFAASFVRDHEAITARDFEYQSPYQATGSGSVRSSYDRGNCYPSWLS